MGREMILHEGVYYTAEDLKALKEREADAEKRAKLQAAADKIAVGGAAACECSERFEKLESLVAEAIDALGDRISTLEDAASADGSDSGDADAAAPAAEPAAAEAAKPKSTRAKKGA